MPRDVDSEQLEALRTFKEELEDRGLLGKYSDPADLVGQVVRAIEADIDESGWAAGVSRPSGPAGAQLRWRHVYEREQQGLDKNGKMKYRTVRNDLLVTNESDVDAQDMRFNVVGVRGTEIHFEQLEDAVTIHGRSSQSWLLISLGGRGSTVGISASWKEGEFEKSQEWTVALEG